MQEDEYSGFFYSALLILGGLFAILNIRIGIRNLKENNNKDYHTLLKENVTLKKRISELEKLIL